MSKEVMFAGVRAMHVRSVKNESGYMGRSIVKMTGPTCIAGVFWYPGNRMPSIQIRIDGRNIDKTMFKELRPVIAVNGWDLDADINLSNAMYHYAEGVYPDGKRMYWANEEEKETAYHEMAMEAKVAFAAKHPDIPSYALQEIWENRNSRTTLAREIRETEIELRQARRTDLVVTRNDANLASILGISLSKAKDIPAGMNKEDFKELIESLLPARMAKMQTAWDCLTSFPVGSLPNDWADCRSMSEHFKKGSTIYCDAMLMPDIRTQHSEGNNELIREFLGMKPAINAVVEGRYAVDYRGATAVVPDEIMDVVNKLQTGEFAVEKPSVSRMGM